MTTKKNRERYTDKKKYEAKQRKKELKSFLSITFYTLKKD